MPFFVMLVSWLVILFFSFGLWSPRRQYTSLLDMQDLLLGEYELGNQVFSHPILPLATGAIVRIH
jgi:hypothetical protein